MTNEELQEIENYKGLEIRKVKITQVVYQIYKNGKKISVLYFDNLLACKRAIDISLEK